jgi:Holliday junction DNA helicase RuvA
VIDRITGVVTAVETESVVVEVSGVGFRVEASSTTLRDLPAEGERVTIYTHLHVREDALQLYGFSSPDERELFNLLIGVSKIGPRLALAALSARRPAEVRRALALGDVAVFQAVPGIGKKTAERLIMELRDRVGPPYGIEGVAAGPSLEGGNLALARSALLELGLSASEVEQLLRGADPAEPVEGLVRRALRNR